MDCFVATLLAMTPEAKTPASRRRFVLSALSHSYSVEQRVNVVLGSMTDVAVQLRAVEQLGVAFAMIDDRRRVGLDGVDATPDFHHHGDVAFDELHRTHHLADALAGEILEVAGFEDRDHAFLDFLTEQLLLVRRG